MIQRHANDAGTCTLQSRNTAAVAIGFDQHSVAGGEEEGVHKVEPLQGARCDQDLIRSARDTGMGVMNLVVTLAADSGSTPVSFSVS